MFETRCSVQLFILLGFGFTSLVSAYEIVPEATIADSPTTLMGVTHIGLSVKDLDQALAFYQQATGFEMIHRETVRGNSAADQFFYMPWI